MKSKQSLYRHRFTHFTDALIPVYNWGFEVLGTRKHETFRERVLELAALEGDECLLDVGCGFGGMNTVLGHQFIDSEIVGIDLSDPLLGLTNRSAQAADLGDRVRFETADVRQIPYPDDSFDVAINTNMVHLVDDAVQMLNEIERILVPDGCLFIADVRRSWIGLLDKTFKSALTLDRDTENHRQGGQYDGRNEGWLC